MIKEILEEIKRVGNAASESFFYIRFHNSIVVYLIYLKYLCEKGFYNIDDVIKDLELYEITEDIKYINIRLNKPLLPINAILRNYRDVSAKDLLLEFIQSFEQPIHYHGKSKAIYVGLNDDLFGYYDSNGKAVYLIPDHLIKDYYNHFIILDEVLGIHNQYLEEKEIDYSKYSYLYIYDDTPKYRFIKNKNEYTKVEYYLPLIKNIILCTNYAKISNFKEGRYLVHYLRTVIISTVKAYLIFKDDKKDEISIINYDSKKIPSNDRLMTIITNNRKIKDVLVKTNVDELKDNNMRIGFHLYELEKENGIRDINHIVDENTRYLDRLNSINERVEKEINRLLNK
jgi:hypothetical protein